MAFVTVKDDYQVTIPEEIVRQLKIEVGDTLEMRVEAGRVVLVPKSKRSSTQKSSLLSLRGANKGSGLYRNEDDAGRYIAELRGQW